MRPHIVPPASAALNSGISSAKLAPLVQRVAEVRRSGVADRLSSAGAVKLVLVRAPAGFGKTTAMVQLRELMDARGVTTAWLTLDRADSDVPRFLAGLNAAVSQLGLERRGGGDQGVLEQLASEDSPFALFLDDFEVIREGGVIGLVRELIEHLPRSGQLIIGSRSFPDLGLGRLRARGQLLELGPEVLRFSPTEASEFFKLRGADMSLEMQDRAYGKTEGWVAALWLLSLALQRHGARSDIVSRMSESARDVADYLTEEVLSQQTPGVRDFLLRTSVLRHLSAPACRALLPNVDCAETLRALERGNVFLIPVENSPDLYRYHSLFADFLRNQLKRERPDDLTRLHLAASGWYESQGRPVPAIDHAIEGGDYPYALQLLEPNARELLEQGRMRLLDRWFSAISPDLLRKRPLLQVIAVWARCFSQGPWTAMEWLQQSGCIESPEPEVKAHVRALLPVLLAMMDRFDEAYEAGQEGIRRLPSGNSFVDSVVLNAMAHIVSVAGKRQEAHRFLEGARRSQGDSAFNRMYTETVGGMLDLREGRLRQATARFRMAITSSSEAATYNYAHGNAWAGVPYAGVVYEANDIAAAERLLNVYLPLARDVGLPDHMISSHRLRSRIAFLHGDVDTALQTLTELEYLGHQRQVPRIIASAKLERSRLLVLQGHVAAAREELSRTSDHSVWASMTQQHRPAQDVDDLFIGEVRVDLHSGNAAQTISALEVEIRNSLTLELLHRALKLRLFLSLAYLQSGDIGRAVDFGIKVLQDASREGFVRLLVDEGPLVGALVRRVRGASAPSGQDPIFSDYLQQLNNLLRGAGTEDELQSTGPGDALAESLTRKEIRVLQLLAEGYSNTAMAEKLIMADSTVRTHLRNINTKLNCRSRTQAVAVARRLGVIR